MRVKGGMGENLGEEPGVAQGEQRQWDAWMGHKAESEAQLQGQFGLRGGSPDLREKHTEWMPGP